MSQRPATQPLPIRDGVAPSFVWLGAGDWPDLLTFLAQRFPQVAAASWLDRMARGEVRDERGSVLSPSSAYRPGACVYYYREPAAETPIPFAATILAQTEHLLVVDKPHFLPVTPGGRFLHETLLVRLKRQTGLDDLVPIHRLDRETAGIVLFSPNPASRGVYQALFREQNIEKTYEAIAPALPGIQFPLQRDSRLETGEPFFVMREVAGIANASTHIELIDQGESLAHYRLQPLSGKQHQLRVHMAAIGAPILNDDFYPIALPCKGDDFSRPLQLLARELRFIDPLDGQAKIFRSERQLAASALI